MNEIQIRIWEYFIDNLQEMANAEHIHIIAQV